MSKIRAVQSLVFSPTGTTRRVVTKVSEGMGVGLADYIDLTTPKSRDEWSGEVNGDLLLMGVPTYYDTIPSILLDHFNKLQGKGKWAVPITVYGNVSPGACLQELCGLLKSRGFRILAAANFIGEHSFSNEDVPLSFGRPDEKDLETAYDFGRKVREKINSNQVEVKLDAAELKVGRNYARRREEYPENDVVSLARVDFNESKCTRCLECVVVCPSGAIDAESLAIDDGLCFRCFACSRACPSDALKPVLVNDIVDYFRSILDKRQEPTLFT